MGVKLYRRSRISRMGYVCLAQKHNMLKSIDIVMTKTPNSKPVGSMPENPRKQSSAPEAGYPTGEVIRISCKAT